MKIYNYPHIDDLPLNVSCIGFFDTVHIGHQKLIKETCDLAKKNHIESCIITFDNCFYSYFNKTEPILTLDEKLKLFEYYGIDNVVVIKFDNEFIKLSSNDFINNYLRTFKIKILVCGYDFTYGYKGQGNIDMLKEETKNYFKLVIIPKIEINGIKISTSLIKEELKKGNDVSYLLGRNERIIYK